MPDDSGVRPSSPTWNDVVLSTPASDVRSLLNVTVTQSPAATWATSGSGLTVPLLTSEARSLGTYAAVAPSTPPGTSTALIARWRGLAPSGHGSPGSDVCGGAPPVCSP